MLMTMIITNISIAQSDQRIKERQERIVDTLFSDEEKNSVQVYFYNNAKKMKFDEDTEDLYSSILHTYTYKISRLDDKDNEMTVEERKDELSKITTTMNKRLSEVLSKENFEIYKSNFDYIVRMLYQKNDWEWRED
jgi:membrane-associated HD superfamily phosphohydrolase